MSDKDPKKDIGVSTVKHYYTLDGESLSLEAVKEFVAECNQLWMRLSQLRIVFFPDYRPGMIAKIAKDRRWP